MARRQSTGCRSGATGSGLLSLPLPFDVALRGLPFFCQAMVLHGVSPQAWRLSNLVSDRIGS